MQEITHSRTFALIQSVLVLLLLLLLLAFKKGPTLLFGGLSLVALIAYHLWIDYRYTMERLVNSGLIRIHIAVYLALCSLVVWGTRVPDQDESPFWIVYFLPIIIAAAQLGLKGTLVTCSATLILFVVHLPPHMYLDPSVRIEELPELIGFGVMFFLVGILVQTFAQQLREQLALQRQLNQQLLQNQQRLKDSLYRLEAAEETLRTRERLASLGEMSAGIAHEIRNPLGIISSSAQLLERETATPDGRQLLDIIQEESLRLNGLITDFLTFGRQLEPQRQPCDLAALIARTLETLQSTAEQKEIVIEFHRRTLVCEAKIDADMIQQVLLNLLLNALDATPSGGKVSVTLRQQDQHLDMVVTDTGCGIPKEFLGKVFDPFFTTKSDGTGLGLANAYKIMESHHGSLSVISLPSKGSTFIASFPLETP
ncbi:MAG: ATP-binding protein [Desulfuromonadales bacterium]|nr:ATP-binding protein [Desulfuromonadales bacterium]